MESLCPKQGDNYTVMDFMRFCEEVRDRVAYELGEEYEATLRNVMKNNQKEFRSIVIRDEKESIMPSIYLESFYEEYSGGVPITEIVKTVIRVYKENRNPWPDGLDLSFGNLREKITFRLVNFERNRELLANMPHVALGEWAVTFECVLNRVDGHVGAFRIDNAMAHEWELTVTDLLRIARENTFHLLPSKVEPIEEVLAELLVKRISEDESFSKEEKEQKTKEIIDGVLQKKGESALPMYVLSNVLNHFGATSVLNIPFMDKIREKLKEDFYILPSSVHELILIPVSAAPERERLLQMVKDVNEREVPEEEYLADGVYRYKTLREEILSVFGEIVA